LTSTAWRDPVKPAEPVRLSDRPFTPAADRDRWYLYQRRPGRQRGSYAGPFDGPDAALQHLRSTVEIELLALIDAPGRSSSSFRIVRSLVGQRRRS